MSIGSLGGGGGAKITGSELDISRTAPPLQPHCSRGLHSPAEPSEVSYEALHMPVKKARSVLPYLMWGVQHRAQEGRITIVGAALHFEHFHTPLIMRDHEPWMISESENRGPRETAFTADRKKYCLVAGQRRRDRGRVAGRVNHETEGAGEHIRTGCLRSRVKWCSSDRTLRVPLGSAS